MKDTFPADKFRRRTDLQFPECFPDMPNTLLCDDTGAFWLACSASLETAEPATVAEALDWAIEAYSQSAANPPWPSALLGRTARVLDAAGIKS